MKSNIFTMDILKIIMTSEAMQLFNLILRYLFTVVYIYYMYLGVIEEVATVIFQSILVFLSYSDSGISRQRNLCLIRKFRNRHITMLILAVVPLLFIYTLEIPIICWINVALLIWFVFRNQVYSFYRWKIY